jgi:SAM-dependent methyltransferase
VIQAALPLPPLEMRQLVGPTDPGWFDNPTGEPIFDFVEPRAFRSVFDFGCGCGRLARQLIQQRSRPERYLGVDLHPGMIAWCQKNLSSAAPGFDFVHHDVYNYHFNPGIEKPLVLPFPAEDGAFSLVEAWSVFTHLTEDQAAHYLREVARILAPGGVFHSTWFLFDRSDGFPMMTDSQNALYVSYIDPSAAAIFDRSWLRNTAAGLDLTIYQVWPVRPAARGFQWHVLMADGDGKTAAPWPADDRSAGWNQPPSMPDKPERIGLVPY